jgi:hypothetical protein
MIRQARWGMRHIVGLLISVVVVAGCERRSSMPDHATKNIPPESAKQAIIQLLRDLETKECFPPGTGELFDYLHSDDYLDKLQSSDLLKNKDNRDKISVDVWFCDLAQLQFRSSFSDNAHRYHIHGSFFSDGQGNWKAKITDINIQRVAK